jgi:hypothetical protein
MFRKIIDNLFNRGSQRKENDAYRYVSRDVVQSVKNNPQKSRAVSQFVGKTYSRYSDELSELSRN